MKTPIQIIEENIEVYSKLYDDALTWGRTINPWITYLTAVSTLETLKYEVLALPSLESKIDTLQRYEATEYPWIDWYYIEENDNWEYVRYENVMDLLNR